jgi:hypothetical protein
VPTNCAILNFDLGIIKNIFLVLCHVSFIRCTYDKNLEMIQPLVQELTLFVFSVLALWWPSQESDDRNLACKLLLVLPSGTYVQSFRSIAPTVTKRAMIKDDDHVR